MGKLNINNGGVDTNKKMPDIDERFGPYTSIEAANAALGGQGRNTITAGLTVGILTANAGVKEWWYQPNKESGLLELIPKGGNAADNPTEGNFASFDENGNVVDSGNKATDFAPADQAVPMGETEDVGKILEKQTNGFGWVDKPVDGKSALDIYNDLHSEDTPLTEAEFIDMLKATYPMKYVEYDGNADSYDVGYEFDTLDGKNAGSTYEHGLYLMPNDATTPTGSVLFICVNKGGDTYKWVKMGDVDIPTNVATKEEIKELDYKFAGKVDIPSVDIDIDDDSASYQNFTISTNTGKWANYAPNKHIRIIVNDYDLPNNAKFLIQANNQENAVFAFCKAGTPEGGSDVNYVDNTSFIVVPSGEKRVYDIPTGTVTIRVNAGIESEEYPLAPTSMGFSTEYVIDEDDSTETKRPLSANQGRVLNERITEVSQALSDNVNDIDNIIYSQQNIIGKAALGIRGVCIGLDNNDEWKWVVPSSSSNSVCSRVAEVNAGDIIVVTANSDRNTIVAFTTDNSHTIGDAPSFMEEEGFDTAIQIQSGTSKKFIVPQDGFMFYNARNKNGNDTRPESGVVLIPINETVDGLKGVAKEMHIYPHLMYEKIEETGTSKILGDYSRRVYGKKYLSTPRLIAIVNTDRGMSITVPLSCYCKVFYYDSSFDYIGQSEWIQLEASVSGDIQFIENCEYAKLMFKNDEDAEGDIYKFVPDVWGKFTTDWDTYNARPSHTIDPNDKGYHRVAVQVNVTNPNCCDDYTEGYNPEYEHEDIRDEEDLRGDYGVIALPESYTNTGAPTRLIIYCHGGGTYYKVTSDIADDDPKFNTQTFLKPNYWLHEGYAILDVEGNPFVDITDDQDEDHDTVSHFHIPQAMDCYVAAYKWAIEHFNLKRDGVFLGGRSMGGGMVFNLLRSPIPVIAACANVPHGMCIGGTTPAGTSGDRQEFYAIHCGFDIPDDFVWDNTQNPYYNGTVETEGSKKKLLYDNWDKLVKNVPIWSLCTDLPTDDESIRTFVDNHYVAGTGHPSRRNELWGKLHAMAKCPIKLFGCYEDTSCPPDDTTNLYYRMFTNAAQICEVRTFHTQLSGTNAHHYDTYTSNNSNMFKTVVCSDGFSMSSVSIVYVEMLQFWRRYEQGN